MKNTFVIIVMCFHYITNRCGLWNLHNFLGCWSFDLICEIGKCNAAFGFSKLIQAIWAYFFFALPPLLPSCWCQFGQFERSWDSISLELLRFSEHIHQHSTCSTAVCASFATLSFPQSNVFDCVRTAATMGNRCSKSCCKSDTCVFDLHKFINGFPYAI